MDELSIIQSLIIFTVLSGIVVLLDGDERWIMGFFLSLIACIIYGFVFLFQFSFILFLTAIPTIIILAVYLFRWFDKKEEEKKLVRKKSIELKKDKERRKKESIKKKNLQKRLKIKEEREIKRLEREKIRKKKEAEQKLIIAKQQSEIESKQNELKRSFFKKNKEYLRDLNEELENYFIFSRCSNCNSTKFIYEKINSDKTSIYVECKDCNKKYWWKSSLVEDEKQNNIYHLIKEFKSHFSKNYTEWNKLNRKSITYRKIKIFEGYEAENQFLFFDISKLKVNIQNISKRHREPIPQHVKDRVWNRDGGQCKECGSNEDLEFDHIIPHVKGGANTYRNIQLLCEPCNRKKSAKIGG